VTCNNHVISEGKKDGSRALSQWFPTSGRDPNQGRGVSDVGSREGFLKNSIIMKKNINIFI
jgi:hypothetical protein